MIAGPTPPHPRLILNELLFPASETSSAAKAESPRGTAKVDSPAKASATASTMLLEIEWGLQFLARDLTLDAGVQVDFLARDAIGLPVAVLAFDAEDEAQACAKLIALDCWFERHAKVLRSALPSSETELRALRWEDGVRLVVITQELGESFHQMLRRLDTLDLAVYELSSLLYQKQRRYFVRGVEPWVRSGRIEPGQESKKSAEEEADLVDQLLARVRAFPGNVDVFGDRYSREVAIDGHPLLRVERGEEATLVWFLGEASHDEALRLYERRELDLVLDRLLRTLLERQEHAMKGSARGVPMAVASDLRDGARGRRADRSRGAKNSRVAGTGDPRSETLSLSDGAPYLKS